MRGKVVAAGLLACVVVVPAPGSVASVPTAADRTCRGVAATIVGTAGDDRITGTRGADVIVGLGGDDRILGRGGDDLVCGNGGGDDLDGGRGHDQLHGGRDGHEERTRRTVITGDLLAGGPGDDHLDAGFDPKDGRVLVLRPDTVTFRDSARAVTVDLGEATAVGEGSDTVVAARSLEVAGSSYDDVLRGSANPETLDGGRGDDAVFGGGGRDAVLGYRGDDQLFGEAGRDLVINTAGVATVDGGDGGDWLIAASPSTTTVRGGAGFDYLSRTITTGDTGVLDGGADEDLLELTPQVWQDGEPTGVLDAAAGTAVVTAGADPHTTEFTSVDSFILWDGDWDFRGSEADDFVQVVLGRLDAQGLGGDDYLLGGDRSDLLDGGDGVDQAWGGKGRNTCLDTEAGDCDGYPWDTSGVRARVVGPQATSPVGTAPDVLVSQWLHRQGPFAPGVSAAGAG